MNAFVAWNAVEPARGQFVFEQHDQWGRTAANDLSNVIDTARAYGLKVGLRLDQPPAWAGGAVYQLDPADVEDYVYHVLRYAGGTIAYVEVFNEMNLPLEWGTSPVDPAAYARILAGAYRGARRADPAVTVISAAPSQRTGGLGGTMEDVDWLNGLYDAGGAASFDALGMHAYLGNFDPATDPACAPMCFRDVELYRAVMVQRGDTARPAFITEFGALEHASTDLGQYAWMELPADVRANNLVQALHMANTQYPWLLGATVFNLDYATGASTPTTSERYWFSLLNRQGPTLAFTSVKRRAPAAISPTRHRARPEPLTPSSASIRTRPNWSRATIVHPSGVYNYGHPTTLPVGGNFHFGCSEVAIAVFDGASLAGPCHTASGVEPGWPGFALEAWYCQCQATDPSATSIAPGMVTAGSEVGSPAEGGRLGSHSKNIRA